MAWIIVGLGNPGDEYKHTRHNTGRQVLEYFAKTREFSDWKADGKSKASMSRGTVGKTLVALLAPDTFMNKSGSAVVKYVKTPKAAERMIVVYDDLDLPLGTLKLSYDRGSGGHKGLESIMRGVKSKKFARIRIGVSPAAASGALKKPSGEKQVNDFILGAFSSHESEIMRRIYKRAADAIDAIVERGVMVAMNEFN
ncbi:MAG TPA: aminoacyl-tRNA hydrolase [Candidatus Paceibacterota bacterium]|nr:aminoacyl-tRNA hydrolase [Candidatus Paceibacterota bacterium]